MSIQNALAGVAAKDLDASVAWYEKVLAAKGSRPMPEVAEWKLASGGALQVFQDRDRAGKSSVTFAVTSLDEQLAALAALGVAVGKTTRSDAVDTAIVTDPDGNRVVFAQAKGDRVVR